MAISDVYNRNPRTLVIGVLAAEDRARMTCGRNTTRARDASQAFGIFSITGASMNRPLEVLVNCDLAAEEASGGSTTTKAVQFRLKIPRAIVARPPGSPEMLRQRSLR